MKKYDFAVIGGGLAGIWMHFQLSKYGKCVVYDQNNSVKSSFVAGGIYNPLMLNYVKKSFKADDIYPNLLNFYGEIESVLNNNIIFSKNIKYVINSNEQLNHWSSEIEKLNNFCKFDDVDFNEIIAPFGIVEVFHSGWVNLKILIESYHNYLENKNEIVYIDENEFELLIKNDFDSNKIVYCRGIRENLNILKPAKGEVLTIKTNFNQEDYIFQQGVFFLPLGDGFYRVGSNFEWKELNNTPTNLIKEEIEFKLKNFFKGNYEIVDHVAGIRPASLDRRPVLGQISDNNFVFNGLGSKGVALAPFYSKMLAENMVKNNEIDLNVSTQRFNFI